jgi:hypothetical protein
LTAISLLTYVIEIPSIKCLLVKAAMELGGFIDTYQQTLTHVACCRSMRVQMPAMKVVLAEMASTRRWLSQHLHNKENLSMRSYWKDTLAWVCCILFLLFPELLSSVPY